MAKESLHEHTHTDTQTHTNIQNISQSRVGRFCAKEKKTRVSKLNGGDVFYCVKFDIFLTFFSKFRPLGFVVLAMDNVEGDRQHGFAHTK